ncbi:ATP-binding cassette (ABC) Superfamily, partial [Phytophthora palmivora]
MEVRYKNLFVSADIVVKDETQLHADLPTISNVIKMGVMRMNTNNHVVKKTYYVSLVDEKKYYDVVAQSRFPRRKLETLTLRMSTNNHVVKKNILRGVSGVLKPGTMTLILGQP